MKLCIGAVHERLLPLAAARQGGQGHSLENQMTVRGAASSLPRGNINRSSSRHYRSRFFILPAGLSRQRLGQQKFQIARNICQLTEVCQHCGFPDKPPGAAVFAVTIRLLSSTKPSLNLGRLNRTTLQLDRCESADRQREIVDPEGEFIFGETIVKVYLLVNQRDKTCLGCFEPSLVARESIELACASSLAGKIQNVAPTHEGRNRFERILFCSLYLGKTARPFFLEQTFCDKRGFDIFYNRLLIKVYFSLANPFSDLGVKGLLGPCHKSLEKFILQNARADFSGLTDRFDRLTTSKVYNG